jgi:hypothetical protein
VVEINIASSSHRRLSSINRYIRALCLQSTEARPYVARLFDSSRFVSRYAGKSSEGHVARRMLGLASQRASSCFQASSKASSIRVLRHKLHQPPFSNTKLLLDRLDAREVDFFGTSCILAFLVYALTLIDSCTRYFGPTSVLLCSLLRRTAVV